MTRKSTVPAGSRKGKPAKPRPDFPLYPHAVGKWAKTVQGRTYYFGTWSDPEGTEQEYLEFLDELDGGPARRSGGPTVRDVCNAFIRSKDIKRKARDRTLSRLFYWSEGRRE